MWTPDEANAGEAQARANMAGLGMTTPQPDPAETGPVDYRQTATARDDTTPFGIPPERYTKGMLSALKNPEALIEMGRLAVEYQQPGWLDFLKRGHEVQRENAGDAMLALVRKDIPGALQLFNASGQHKADSIDDNGDGTFNVNVRGADGKPYVRKVNPEQDLATFLTPPKFLEQQNREAKVNQQMAAVEARSRDVDARLASAEKIADAKRQMEDKVAEIRDRYQTEKNALGEKVAQDRANYQMGLLDAKMQGMGLQGALLDSKRGLLQAQTELANARTGAVGAGKPVNWNTINSQITTHAKLNDYAMVEDKQNFGKKKLDHGRANTLASIAQKMAREDPESYAASPAATVEAAVAKLKVIEQQVGEQVDTAAKVVSDAAPFLIGKADFWQNVKLPVNGKTVVIKATGPADFKTKAAEALTKAALSNEGLGPTPEKSTGSRTATGTISRPATGAAPYPDGTPLTGPDGKKYVVQGGKPVPVGAR